MTTLTSPPAAAVRTPAVEHRVIHSLDELLVRQVEAVLERAGRAGGPVFLYGAGQHTWWLLGAVPAVRELPVVAIIDDAATPGTRMDGLPVLRPDDAVRAHGLPAAVVLSTDTWQAQLGARARAAFGAGTRVIDLYEGLPPGPYWRGSPLVSRAVQRPLREPSDLCIRRCAARIAPFLSERGLGRVFLLGDWWRTFAAARELIARGFEPVHEARRADCAIVCDRAMEFGPLTNVSPGLRGPLFTVWRGRRPWLASASAWTPVRTEEDAVLLRLECGREHAQRALTLLPSAIRSVWGGPVRIGVQMASALAATPAGVDDAYGPKDDPGAWDVELTITDPPSGVDAAEWLAIQAELSPFEIGAGIDE